MKTISAPAAAQPPGPVANPRRIAFRSFVADQRLGSLLAIVAAGIADSDEAPPEHDDHEAWRTRIASEFEAQGVYVHNEDALDFVLWFACRWKEIPALVKQYRWLNAMPEQLRDVTPEDLLLPENHAVWRQAAAHITRGERASEEVTRSRQRSMVRARRLRSQLNTMMVRAARRAPTVELDRRVGWRPRGRTHRPRRRVATRASTGDDAGGEPGEHHAAAGLPDLRSIAAAYLAVARSRLRAYRLRREGTRRMWRPARGGSI